MSHKNRSYSRQAADQKRELAQRGVDRARRCAKCHALIDGDDCWRCEPETAETIADQAATVDLLV